MKKHILSAAVVAVFVVLAWGSSDDDSASTSATSEVEPAQTAAKTPPRQVTLPPYKIIKEDELHNIKRTIDVRLEGPIDEAELRALALALKTKETKKFERTFIGYLLPGMKLGAGSWATTHFNPDLEIVIFGMRRGEAEKLAAKAKQPGRKVIGTWIDQQMPSTITVYKKKKKTYLERAFADGSSMSEELRTKKTAKGLKLTPVEKNDFGEFYIIKKNGSLESWDKEGLIDTKRPK